MSVRKNSNFNFVDNNNSHVDNQFREEMTSTTETVFSTQWQTLQGPSTTQIQNQTCHRPRRHRQPKFTSGVKNINWPTHIEKLERKNISKQRIESSNKRNASTKFERYHPVERASPTEIEDAEFERLKLIFGDREKSKYLLLTRLALVNIKAEAAGVCIEVYLSNELKIVEESEQNCEKKRLKYRLNKEFKQHACFDTKLDENLTMNPKLLPNAIELDENLTMNPKLSPNAIELDENLTMNPKLSPSAIELDENLTMNPRLSMNAITFDYMDDKRLLTIENEQMREIFECLDNFSFPDDFFSKIQHVSTFTNTIEQGLELNE